MLLKHNLFFCDQANKSKLKKRIERNVTFLHNKHKSMIVGLTAILVLKKGHARLTSAIATIFMWTSNKWYVLQYDINHLIIAFERTDYLGHMKFHRKSSIA